MRFLTVTFLLAVGCGDNSVATPDAPIVPDAPTGFVEAPHANVPQVISGGGPVTTAPKVVPIFFTGDSDAQVQLEMFLGALVGSSYWTATTSEYGVGPLTIAPSIVSTDAPLTTDAALQTWLAAKTDGTHPGWPAPDVNTIYTVFLPAGVVLDQGGGNLSCKAFGAYHSEAPDAHGGQLTYALVPRCASTLGTVVDTATVATSHELVEAATDPLPFTNNAFVQLDDEHFVWGRTPGGELGDMCEYITAAPQRMVGNFLVQRTWSNASALAGHDPCVPVLATPYAGAAPAFDDITITTHSGTITTKGETIAVGESKTIEVTLFSDAEGPDWTVGATDAAALLGGSASLQFQWGRQYGHNGTKLQLIITRTKAATGMRGNEFVITSNVNNVMVAMWWGLVN
ncbi:MAG: hypothetical protein JWO36_3286 [Myxococcales bacterium]|nr:hypothetical protein [Myxococcales bacterium]